MIESLLDFLQMGGYARYVWPPYLLTAILLTAIAAAAFRRRRKALQELRELRKPEELRRS